MNKITHLFFLADKITHICLSGKINKMRRDNKSHFIFNYLTEGYMCFYSITHEK